MEISNDSFATLLLCSDLALPSGAKSFTTIQWYKLAERLWSLKLTPESLFEIDATAEKIHLSVEETERIKRLLDRAGQFGIAMSALNDKGIFTLTKGSSEYPGRLKSKLKRLAPPVLYYSGNLKILENDGVAIVGSRDVKEDGLEFTRVLAEKCVESGVNIVSGGARGVDSIAENVSNSLDGTSLIIVADSLEKKLRKKETRTAILRNETLVLSASRPDRPFSVYTAMNRNKYVYAMANYVVAVSSDANKGGTWAGATENLKHGWTPLFVRDGNGLPKGNQELLKMDEVASITMKDVSCADDVFSWFRDNQRITEPKDSASEQSRFKQLSFFEVKKSDS